MGFDAAFSLYIFQRFWRQIFKLTHPLTVEYFLPTKEIIYCCIFAIEKFKNNRNEDMQRERERERECMKNLLTIDLVWWSFYTDRSNPSQLIPFIPTFPVVTCHFLPPPLPNSPKEAYYRSSDIPTWIAWRRNNTFPVFQNIWQFKVTLSISVSLPAMKHMNVKVKERKIERERERKRRRDIFHQNPFWLIFYLSLSLTLSPYYLLHGYPSHLAYQF